MYTKGEWNVRGNTIFINDSYRSIATVHVQKNFEDITFKPIEDVEAIANAKLISQAPSMYEAIKDILDTFDEPGVINTEWIKSRLENAIK